MHNLSLTSPFVVRTFARRLFMALLLGSFWLSFPTSSLAQACNVEFVTKWGTPGIAAGEFDNPVGVAVDNAGNVYVADTFNSRIQKFTSTGAFLTQWGAPGILDGEFSGPFAIAADGNGNVYVADTLNNRIQKFTNTGTHLFTVGGLAPGNGNGQFDTPTGIAVDSNGNVYVSDTFNNRIQKFDSTGAYLTQWNVNTPGGIAVDALGNVYVADNGNSQILKFDSNGNFLLMWGSNGAGPGQFDNPIGVAVDALGNVYVADSFNHRIQKFTSTGGFLLQWGTPGAADGQFDNPSGVAVDNGGNIYVADRVNNRIQKFRQNCGDGPSAQRPGSLLVFPYYTSKAAQQADTRLTLTNVGAQQTYVHLFMIDGARCQQTDFYLCLTPFASFAFKASEYDPETTGYLLAVAVNANGLPIQYNSLIGNAFVSDGEYVGNYGAESFWAHFPAVATLNPNGTATLLFGGGGYDAVPNQFAVEIQSPVDAAGQQIVTVGLSGDVTTSQLGGAAQVGVGLVVNERETPVGSFTNWLTGTCQARATITTVSPRVPSGMGTLLRSGQGGTMRLNVGAAVGLLMTPRTAPWRGIRALHKTARTTSTLTIPVFLPVC